MLIYYLSVAIYGRRLVTSRKGGGADGHICGVVCTPVCTDRPCQSDYSDKQKEMTARNTSVGADDRQSLHVTNYSITNQNGNINAFLLKGGGMNG